MTTHTPYPSAVEQAEHHLGLSQPRAEETHMRANGIINGLLFTGGLFAAGLGLVWLMRPVWDFLDSAPLPALLVVSALVLVTALVVIGRLKRRR